MNTKPNAKTLSRRPSLLRDQRGAGMVEYLILVGLIAIVGIAGFRLFGGNVNRRINTHAIRINGI